MEKELNCKIVSLWHTGSNNIPTAKEWSGCLRSYSRALTCILRASVVSLDMVEARVAHG